MLIGPTLTYSYFKNWPWKYKVKIMCEVIVQSHNMSLTSYWLTSLWFHVNWPSHSWDTAFSNLTLKIQSQCHSWRSYSRYNTLSTHIPFVPCRSALPFLGYSILKIWPWKSSVKVKCLWCCTTKGPDKSIELHSGVAPCTQIRSCIHMASEVVPQTPPNTTILLWLFKIFRGRTPNSCKNVGPSALVGHGLGVSDRNPTITAIHHFMQSVCLHIISTKLRHCFKWYKSIQWFQIYGFCKVWPKCCLI